MDKVNNPDYLTIISDDVKKQNEYVDLKPVHLIADMDEYAELSNPQPRAPLPPIPSYQAQKPGYVKEVFGATMKEMSPAPVNSLKKLIKVLFVLVVFCIVISVAALVGVIVVLSNNEGTTGPVGPQGMPGMRGEQGPAGESGPQGATGESGLPGNPGGATGATGRRGQTGGTGQTGPRGLSGAPGPSGAMGERGLIGPMGNTGSTGPMGPPGFSASELLNERCYDVNGIPICDDICEVTSVMKAAGNISTIRNCYCSMAVPHGGGVYKMLVTQSTVCADITVCPVGLASVCPQVCSVSNGNVVCSCNLQDYYYNVTQNQCVSCTPDTVDQPGC